MFLSFGLGCFSASELEELYEEKNIGSWNHYSDYRNRCGCKEKKEICAGELGGNEHEII